MITEKKVLNIFKPFFVYSAYHVLFISFLHVRNVIIVIKSLVIK